LSPVDRRRRRSSGSKPQVANRDGRLHALATPRAAVWMGIGIIIKKDWTKMAQVCRKRSVVSVGFKRSLPGVPRNPPGPPYAPVSPCGWVGLEWKRGGLLGTLLHGKRGRLSSKYGI